MRTTVSLDDHLLTAAKRRARDRGQTLGQVVEDALRRELADSPGEPATELPVLRGGDGLRPGVDVTSNRAMRELVDDGVELTNLR